MMRRVAVWVIVLLAVTARPVLGQTGERVIPSDRVVTFVHVRSAADSAIASKGQLRIRESLPLVRSVPRWYEVQLPDGSSGFVSKAWTTITHPLGVKVKHVVHQAALCSRVSGG